MRQYVICAVYKYIHSFNNYNIMIDGKQLFYKGCFENNITRVDDLLDNNGDFFYQFQLKAFSV